MSRESIEAVRAEWPVLFNAGDIDRLGDHFYAENAVALPGAHEPVEGRAAIVSYLREVRESGDVGFELGVIETVVVGDLGYVIGTYVFTSDDGSRANGVTLETYRPQHDGTWKCVVDMWHNTA